MALRDNWMTFSNRLVFLQDYGTLFHVSGMYVSKNVSASFFVVRFLSYLVEPVAGFDAE